MARKPKLCEYAKGIQERAKRRAEPERQHVIGQGDRRGISFQFPPGWDDGSGKIQHVKDGPFKGRVMFTSRAQAEEVAKRYEGTCGQRARYDPD
jgi:hypothetical protein